MEEFYLCSRSELARKVNLDTGKKATIIGAPDEFIEWLDMILPFNPCVVHSIEELEGHHVRDVMILWSDEQVPDSEEIDKVWNLLDDGSIWVVHQRYDTGSVADLILDLEKSMVLTAKCDISPLRHQPNSNRSV